MVLDFQEFKRRFGFPLKKQRLSESNVPEVLRRDASTSTFAAATNPILTSPCTQNCATGPDVCFSVSRDRNFGDSGADMGLESSAHNMSRDDGTGYREKDKEDESTTGGEGLNRKGHVFDGYEDRERQLDTASVCEDGVFFCDSCGQTAPLKWLYPMLRCDCLLCNSCCRLHVESSLSDATRRARYCQELGLDSASNAKKGSTDGGLMGDTYDIQANHTGLGQLETTNAGDEYVLGQGYRIQRDKRVNSASNAKKGTADGRFVGDTYNMEAKITGLGQGETINAAPCEEHEESVPGESQASLDAICCPTPSCSGSLQLSEAQKLAPEAFRRWEEAASKDLVEQSTSYINCPGCGVVIEKVASELPPGIALSGVPELDRTLPFIELDSEGKRLSRSALCHRAEHRFRCSLCSVNFCGKCMTVPYHLGKTCEEFEEEKNSVKCFYCEAPIRSRRLDETTILSTPPSVRELRKELDTVDVDTLWCMEKQELVGVQKFASSVCSSEECRTHLRAACTRNLDCGHHCRGVRGERLCLPCLEEDCLRKVVFPSGNRHLPSADELCTICMVEPLRQAPSIHLHCGHVVHLHCAQMKLEEGFPGPAISFGYLNCPQCSEMMQHPSLKRCMKKPLALSEEVKKKALTRLKMEGLFSSAKELKAGGRFEGRPTEFALQLYQYYVCFKCSAPYFGGQRNCAPNDGEQNGNAHDRSNLVCGGCSSAASGKGLCQKGHGKEFVEFKCKFCCSIATYFCFGSTHFCESCHKTRPDAFPDLIPVQCKGPKRCPLLTAHAPNGQECCLGCSMCRLHGQ